MLAQFRYRSWLTRMLIVFCSSAAKFRTGFDLVVLVGMNIQRIANYGSSRRGMLNRIRHIVPPVPSS